MNNTRRGKKHFFMVFASHMASIQRQKYFIVRERVTDVFHSPFILPDGARETNLKHFISFLQVFFQFFSFFVRFSVFLFTM
jgi:hypothetical protein